ncbi:MAG: alanine--tRNA ligase [Phycisphaerales bacterium]
MTESVRGALRGQSAATIRQGFIDFFAQRHGHTVVPSSPAVPVDDPTLLFTNAGMNQFKPCFLGTTQAGSPLHGLRRAVNSQKCIRAGGKHNDLDDVGKDTYHHTFFEMLGNWSFGDFFKTEAIQWAWEFLTEVCGLPADRLYATYFEGDPAQQLDPDFEARDLWLRFLPPERVLPGNAKDNFWEMGDTGPCGPCSEIHFDRIGGRDAAPMVNHDDPDVIEVWNLVFIQFNREKRGDTSMLKPLPAKHVDTGMGLERLVSILQDKRSNYDTDIFTPIFAAIQKATGFERGYSGRLSAEDADRVDMAYRVIADHIRTLVVAIADGATPSNEGRGYVLRRVLRRAVRFGRQMLGAKTGFLTDLVPVVAKSLAPGFPDITRDTARIAEILADEEESFGRTLDKGIKRFDELADDGSVSGDDAFMLYDTFGFPLDLTQMMAEERGLTVDVAGFNAAMEAQRERSRAGSKFGSGEDRLKLEPDALARLAAMHIKPTDDSHKYASADIRARIRAIWNGRTFDEHADAANLGLHKVGVVLDRTPFYAEAGGQVADHGRLVVLGEHRRDSGSHRQTEFRVEEVQRFGEYVLHIGHVIRGVLRVGEEVECKVDRRRRARIAANHTATHLLNLALRNEMGDGVDQKGSLVDDEKLRFDFSSPAPVEDEQVGRIESAVRAAIEDDLPVSTGDAPLYLAKGIRGVRAVFGETYPDPVRVVAIGAEVPTMLESPDDARWAGLSTEFCGGTHLARTGEAEAFVVLSETGVAKGIRRIEAVTGVAARAAQEAARSVREGIGAAAGLPDADIPGAISELSGSIDRMPMSVADKAALRGQLAGLQDRAKAAAKAAASQARERAVGEARQIAESAAADLRHVIVAQVSAGEDRQALQTALQVITDRCPTAAVLLASASAERVSLIAQVPEALVKRGLNAGAWIRATAEVCGGKGGGKPQQAQGGGTQPDKLREAMREADAFAARIL